MSRIKAILAPPVLFGWLATVTTWGFDWIHIEQWDPGWRFFFFVSWFLLSVFIYTRKESQS